MGNKILLPSAAQDAAESFPPSSYSTNTLQGMDIDELCMDEQYKTNPWLRYHPAKYNVRLYPSYCTVEDKKTLNLSSNGKLIRKEHPYQRLEQYMGHAVRTGRPLVPPQNSTGMPVPIVSPLLLSYDLSMSSNDIDNDGDHEGPRHDRQRTKMPGHDSFSTLQVMAEKMQGPTATPIVETIAMVIDTLP